MVWRSGAPCVEACTPVRTAFSMDASACCCPMCGAHGGVTCLYPRQRLMAAAPTKRTHRGAAPLQDRALQPGGQRAPSQTRRPRHSRRHPWTDAVHTGPLGPPQPQRKAQRGIGHLVLGQDNRRVACGHTHGGDAAVSVLTTSAHVTLPCRTCCIRVHNLAGQRSPVRMQWLPACCYPIRVVERAPPLAPAVLLSCVLLPRPSPFTLLRMSMPCLERASSPV